MEMSGSCGPILLAFITCIIVVVVSLKAWFIHTTPIIFELEKHNEEFETTTNDGIVVVFVIDGFRLDALVARDGNDSLLAPFLHSLLVNNDANANLYVLQTPKPSESRPMHTALFCGTYEDPANVYTNFESSAVMPQCLPNIMRNESFEVWCIKNTKQPIVNWSRRFMGDAFLSAAAEHQRRRVFYSRERCNEVIVSEMLAMAKVNSNALQSKRFVHVNLQAPDQVNFVGSGEEYEQAIRSTDEAIRQLISLFNTTLLVHRNLTFLIVSDHGRHVEGHHGTTLFDEVVYAPMLVVGAAARRRSTASSACLPRAIDIDSAYVHEFLSSLSNYPVDEIRVARQVDVATQVALWLGVSVPVHAMGSGFAIESIKDAQRVVKQLNYYVISYLNRVMSSRNEWFSSFLPRRYLQPLVVDANDDACSQCLKASNHLLLVQNLHRREQCMILSVYLTFIALIWWYIYVFKQPTTLVLVCDFLASLAVVALGASFFDEQRRFLVFIAYLLLAIAYRTLKEQKKTRATMVTMSMLLATGSFFAFVTTNGLLFSTSENEFYVLSVLLILAVFFTYYYASMSNTRSTCVLVVVSLLASLAAQLSQSAGAWSSARVMEEYRLYSRTSSEDKVVDVSNSTLFFSYLSLLCAIVACLQWQSSKKFAWVVLFTSIAVGREALTFLLFFALCNVIDKQMIGDNYVVLKHATRLILVLSGLFSSWWSPSSMLFALNGGVWHSMRTDHGAGAHFRFASHSRLRHGSSQMFLSSFEFYTDEFDREVQRTIVRLLPLLQMMCVIVVALVGGFDRARWRHPSAYASLLFLLLLMLAAALSSVSFLMVDFADVASQIVVVTTLATAALATASFFASFSFILRNECQAKEVKVI